MKILFFFLTASLMAQTVEYDFSAATASGLSVSSARNPEFPEHYKQLRILTSSSALLVGLEPFALILRNDSNEAKGYITVRYTYNFLDGSVGHGTETIQRDLILGPLVKPDDVYFISQVSTPVSSGVSRAFSNKEVEQYRELLAKCYSVKISLDAVELENGSLVGPDEGRLRIRIDSEKRADRELRNSSHTRTYLESLRRAPRALWSPELGNSQADYWYTEARRKIATRLLEEMK